MTPRTLHVGLLAALLLTAAPALAQPVDDPFEAIVANPDGSTAQLNDVSIPVRNPTRDEIRQYVEAFRVINMDANLRVSDSVRHGRVGPFKIPGGSTVSFKAGYVKRRGESEAVLRTLEMVPSGSMSMGPIKFNRMTLDNRGVLRFKLNLNVMGIDFWPQELTVEKVYRDSKGNTVFETGGNGLAGAFGPDLRITPKGKVQRYSKGFLGIGWGWLGAGWKDVTENGAVPETIQIRHWPPRATDLIEWLNPEPVKGYPTAGAVDLTLLDAIPIEEMNLTVSADADPVRIDLSEDGGHINLTNHHLDFEANGRFENRTYVSDPNKRNGYTATADISGDVHLPGMPSARIDGLELRATGEHEGSIPFDRPEDLSVTAGLDAQIDGDVSDLRFAQPGGLSVHAPGKTKFDVDASGKLTLRPFNADSDAQKELVISRDSRYSFSADGPVTIDGLNTATPEGVTLPNRMTVVAADDPETPEDENQQPVLQGEGDMGTKMGFVFTRTDVQVNGKSTNGGAIGILNGDDNAPVSISGELKPGARLHLDGYAFAGIKEDDFMSGRTAGGVRFTTDARVSGTLEDTKIEATGSTIELNGETDLEARAASNIRYGTRNGAETQIRSVGASGSLTLREGEGSIDGGLPGGPVVNGRLAAGTSIGFDTGVIRRADPRGTVLQTEDYDEGKKGAKLTAHLVLTAGTVAHRDFALAFNGRTTIDLTAALGFRFDPAQLAQGNSQMQDPILAGVDLSMGFGRGSTLKLSQPNGNEGTLRLSDQTRITLHTEATVAPDGTPTLSSAGMDVTISAEAIDLKTILDPALGRSMTAGINSRSTVRIKNARVTFLRNGGMRIRHDGVSIEIAPGEIVIGR